MRFDEKLQLWVDENNVPLPNQPPAPTNVPVDGLMGGQNYDFSPYKDPNSSFQEFGIGLGGRENFSTGAIDINYDFSQNPNVQNSATPSNFNPNSNAMKKFIGGLPTMETQDFSNVGQALNTDVKYKDPEEKPYDAMGDFANSIGKSYSLESSLYGLGYAMSPKDRTGMTEEEIKRDKQKNLISGIGSGGKALVGGARTFMSGLAQGKMDNWQTEEYKKKRREALVNNQTGVENAYAMTGGLNMYQDGGQQGGQEEDVMNQLQQAVDSGQMTEEEAMAYLQQMQGQGGEPQEGQPQEQAMEGGQEEPQQGGQASMEEIQAQLQQAVENGEMSEEQAMAYMQQLQQGSGNAENQGQEEPQMSPEQAQAELARAVENGEITEEEAQTYLQQLYGDTQVSSLPKEPYTGAVREGIRPEEYLTGEVTTGDENKPHNAEVEKGEYINRQGVTQQVVGDKHSKGGEKMNLEKGTIVITDKGKIGAANARALSIQTGMKLNAGDTYSRVIDIFNKKIGLEKLNEEQEELFKKVQKYQGKGNEKTQELNNEFLNAKISNIEEKKQELLQQREQLVQVLYELQEQAKPKEQETSDGVPMYAKGTKVGDDPVVTEGDPTKVGDGLKTGDVAGEYILQRYGDDAYQYYLDNWHNDPDYDFRNYAKMRDRIKDFAKDYGVELPKGFEKYNETQMNNLAGQLQKKVPDAIANDYGRYVAPTQSGLQWLVDNNVLTKDNPVLKGIIRNGKITIGSYGALNKDQQQVVRDAVNNMDETKINNYSSANFRDNKWFYRRPKEETIYFKDKAKFDEFTANNRKVGDRTFATSKVGAYVNPILLQEKKLDSLKAVEEYKAKYKDNPDKVHKNFLSEGDPMVYNYVTGEDPVAEPEAPKGLEGLKSKKRSNNFMMPDQSTLPPEALRAVPKYDIRYNYLDNIKLSPEQNLMENYRTLEEAKSKMEGLPDMMGQANIAQLSGNIAQANNQAINQMNAVNLQANQQVAQANLGILNRQVETDQRLADQYDTRMNKAIDTTRKDIEGYYDFNRRVNVGEFNTRHQLSLLNDLFDKYGVNPDGTVKLDPKTNAPFYINNAEAIKYAEYKKAQEEKLKLEEAKKAKQAEKVDYGKSW